MSRKCEFCGKRTEVGNKRSIRGKAKYLGGVGLKVTGVTKRKFKPNIQKVRADMNGTIRKVKICTRCMATGKIKKPSPRPKMNTGTESNS